MKNSQQNKVGNSQQQKKVTSTLRTLNKITLKTHKKRKNSV